MNEDEELRVQAAKEYAENGKKKPFTEEQETGEMEGGNESRKAMDLMVSRSVTEPACGRDHGVDCVDLSETPSPDSSAATNAQQAL